MVRFLSAALPGPDSSSCVLTDDVSYLTRWRAHRLINTSEPVRRSFIFSSICTFRIVTCRSPQPVFGPSVPQFRKLGSGGTSGAPGSRFCCWCSSLAPSSGTNNNFCRGELSRNKSYLVTVFSISLRGKKKLLWRNLNLKQVEQLPE